MQKFPFDEIDQLYREAILDHYRNSRNKVRIEAPDIEFDEYNPICGDRVVLQLKLKDGFIAKGCFQGEGCSISQASASMMTGLLAGKTLEEAEELADGFRELMYGKSPPEGHLEVLGELEALQAVRRFPVRIKCALLAWTALEEGIGAYRVAKNASQ